MWVVSILLALVILWSVRSFWPVSGLRFIDHRNAEYAAKETTVMKILDVRDAYDYEKCHTPGSINISLGRLPFVWKKDLSPGEPVLILADSRRKSIQAARVLKNKGFNHLYAARGLHCP